MAEREALNVEELVAQHLSLARSIPGANRALLEASLDSLLGPTSSPGSTYALSRLEHSARLFLVRQQQRLLFYLFRLGAPQTAVVMDTRFTAAFRPTPPEPKPAPARSADLSFRLTLPGFVVLKPTSTQLEAYGPRRATPENTILLELGDALRLAVKDPEEGTGWFDADLRLTRGGVDIKPIKDGERWLFMPFQRLLARVRDWVLGRGEREELTLARLPETRSSFWELIAVFARLYIGGQSALSEGFEATWPARGEETSERHPMAEFRTRFALSSFAATSKLLLNKAGRLATRSDKDTIQLRLKAEADQNRITVDLQPPDFLASGPIYQQFLEALRSDMAAELLAKLKSESGAANLTASELAALLSASHTEIEVFRVSRGSTDRDVFVVQGALRGEAKVVITRADFAVDVLAEPPRVSFKAGSLELLHFGDRDAAEPDVHEDAIDYFLQLITQIKTWSEAL